MTTASFDPARTRQTLLIRLRDSGDHQAWDEFHARYAPMIGGWCRQWFPRETEDMVQEVLLLLAKRLRDIRVRARPATGRFRGYLKTVTQRLMADLKEREHGRWVVQGDGLVEEVEASQDLEERLKSEFDLELLEKAKDNVRSPRRAEHLAGVRGNGGTRAERCRGGPRARHESRGRPPGQVPGPDPASAGCQIP